MFDDYFEYDEKKKQFLKNLHKEAVKQAKKVFRKIVWNSDESSLTDYLFESLGSKNENGYRKSSYNEIKSLSAKFDKKKLIVTVSIHFIFNYRLFIEIAPGGVSFCFDNYPKEVKGIVKDDKDLALYICSLLCNTTFEDNSIVWEKHTIADERDFLKKEIANKKLEKNRKKVDIEEKFENQLSVALQEDGAKNIAVDIDVSWNECVFIVVWVDTNHGLYFTYQSKEDALYIEEDSDEIDSKEINKIFDSLKKHKDILYNVMYETRHL